VTRKRRRPGLAGGGASACGLLLGVVAGAAPALAADPAGDPAPNPTIIVTGTALDQPGAMAAYGQTTIARDRLQSEASGRVEDVLRDIAGFSEYRRSDSRSANPSAQGANLRSLGGNAASRTLVLLDGVPLADPFFGSVPYTALVPDRLSRIVVTRGGGVGAFGAGAVAGTIEMESAGRADLNTLSASAFYGSRNSQEYTGAFSPDVGGGFLSVSGRYERGDGFETTPASQVTPATVTSRYQSWSTGLRAVAPIDATTELQARVLVYRDDRTLRFAGADSHAQGEDASLRLVARGPWQVDALAYVQARNFSNVVISSTTFLKTLNQRNTPALGLGGKIELRPPVGEHQVLRLGLDGRQTSADMDEDAYNANLASDPLTLHRLGRGRQFVGGGFVEDDWSLGSLLLTGGARADHWTITQGSLTVLTPAGAISSVTLYPDRSGWEGSGRVGAVWKAAAPLSLRAAAYTGFRLPTLNELYRTYTVYPVTTNANPNLAPERLRGVEVGADLVPVPGLSLGVTLFDNRLDNAIANVTIATNVQQRQNVAAIEAQGVEAMASAALGAFTLTGAYTYSYAKVRAPGAGLNGLDPAQSPRHAASTTLAWQAHGGVHDGARLSATLRYIGRQYEDDLNTSSLPGAVTVDGYVRVPLRKGVALIGRAENIFNATVYTRWVTTPSLSQDLGTPRTLWLGIAAAL
jgi:outer membrane receptor protein involved in Fe transport